MWATSRIIELGIESGFKGVLNMITQSMATDYLAVSKIIAEVLPKAQTTILYHQDARLAKLNVSDYYELQLGCQLNGTPVSLYLYRDPVGHYTLTDLGTLIFENQIMAPLVKTHLDANKNAQEYENYDVFACHMLKEAWFTKLLARFDLQLKRSMDITTDFNTLPKLKDALRSFLDFFNDLLDDQSQIKTVVDVAH